MKKLCGVFFCAGTFLFSSTSVFAEHRVEEVEITKVRITDQRAVVTISNINSDIELDNLDGCTNTVTEQQAAIDLSSNPYANYLYTHLMTAMVSNKPVHLLLDGCVPLDQLESLPAIISAEIIN